MDNYHTPVLLQEVLTGLVITPGNRYIDATLGGGGHFGEIVKRGGIVLGIDVDPEAIEHTEKELRTQNPELKEGKEWTLVQGNFRNIEQIVKEHGFEHVDGVLFDLGVSSHQIDTEDRGFSYRFNGALDMRMDQGRGETAASLVNRLSENELYDIFALFGEEELARPIARAICLRRASAPIQSVDDLVESIDSVVHDKRQVTPVRSRIFQALRIAVNDELHALESGLIGASHVLKKGGRLAIISFHSLEDRKVKLFFHRSQWRMVTKRPIVASQSEIMENPRARSAKLRIAEKLS